MSRLTLADYRTAADFLRGVTAQRPAIAVITGSGLGGLADRVAEATSLPTTDVPGWPQSTVEGHAGRLVFGTIGGVPVLVMKGRIHFYEGYPMQQVAMPVRVMQQLGIRTLVVTNAAGGINPDFHPGTIMAIRDHIFLPGMAGNHPLHGPNDEALGPRFPDVSAAYSPDLRALAHEVAAAQGLDLAEGTYVMVAGPSFETRAEVRFLRAIGGDAVGMSTAPEVIVASHGGMAVLGLSLITNVHDTSGRPATEATTSHEEVLEEGQRAAPRLLALVEGIITRLAGRT